MGATMVFQIDPKLLICLTSMFLAEASLPRSITDTSRMRCYPTIHIPSHAATKGRIRRKHQATAARQLPKLARGAHSSDRDGLKLRLSPDYKQKDP